MNVHDVGSGAKFEPGVTFTNEPGIYVRPDALDYMPCGWKQEDWEKFKTAVSVQRLKNTKSIGVRIEDDMLITPDGVKWMSAALPRKISDIEDFMAKAKSVGVQRRKRRCVVLGLKPLV